MADVVSIPITDGETWCTIAKRCYGDETLTKYLIYANPTIPVTARIYGFTSIFAPILDASVAPIPKQLFPLWKQ